MTETAAVLLELEGVSKRFASSGRVVDALRDVSASLGSGSIVGVFGNNGAGKTTLMRTIAGSIEPTSGRIRIAGRTVGRRTPAVQAQLGLCSADERSFYPRLSALENLRLFARLHGLSEPVARERIRRHTEIFALSSFLDRPFQDCSSGQRQRLNLVRAMLHEPRVLMLDEAARSAEPAMVEALGAHVREYVERGRLLLFASHEFEGIERLCDRILVLDQGRVVLAGPREEVLSRLVEPAWKLVFRSSEARARALARFPSLRAESDAGAALHPMGADGALTPALVEISRALGEDLVALERRTRLSVRELLLQISTEPALAESLARAREQVSPPSSPPVERGPLDRGNPAGSSLGAVSALVRRDRLIHTSHRFKLLLQTALMLVWAALFFCVSRLVQPTDPDVERWLHGGYFAFVLFGLAALQISQVCLLHMGHALREEQLQGTIEPLVVTGRAPFLLLISSLIWPLLTSVASMAILVGAGVLVFGADLSGANWAVVVIASALTVVALSAWGVLSAAFVLAFKRGDPVAILLNVAALLVGGAYFPIKILPAWLQRVSQLVPITHGLRAVRAAALDGASLGSPECLRPITSLLVLAAVLLPLSWWGLSRSIAYARARGSLCHS